MPNNTEGKIIEHNTAHPSQLIKNGENILDRALLNIKL